MERLAGAKGRQRRRRRGNAPGSQLPLAGRGSSCPRHLARSRSVSGRQRFARGPSPLPGPGRVPPGAPARLAGAQARLRAKWRKRPPLRALAPSWAHAAFTALRSSASRPRVVTRSSRVRCLGRVRPRSILLMVSTVTPVCVRAANSSCVRPRCSRALRSNLPRSCSWSSGIGSPYPVP